MPQGYVKPANAIIADVEGLVSHEYEVGANATAVKMLPGIAVIYDTVDYAVKEAGAKAEVVIGILDVAPAMLRSGHYAVADECRIIEKGKCVVLLKAGGAAVTPGVALVTAADGYLEKQAVGALGTQGAVVAYALESVNPVAASFCLAKVVNQREAAAAA